MEKNNNNSSINHNRERLGVVIGGGFGGDHRNELLRTATHPPGTRSSSGVASTSSDFVLQWGNRKRLRCMKIQVKDHNNSSDPASAAAFHRTTVRVDRRIVRSDNNKDSTPHQPSVTTATANGNGYLNLRQRPSSPSNRILRNSEKSIGMKGHGNGVVRALPSPDRGSAQDKRGSSAHHTTTTTIPTNSNNNHAINNGNYNGGGSGSSETAHDSKKGGSSGSDMTPTAWPPKFMIALTNKEKEEDFIAFKGSKLPQRPKKRAKFIQRTVNLVCPGAWLCDLTLERYEVREKKISKKRPQGLKAMGNMDSDSE